MDDVKRKDIERQNIERERGKTRIKKIENMKNYQRNVCKKWLHSTECEGSCTTLLRNLTLEIFSRYLANQKETSSRRYLGRTTYGSMQSALCHLYRLCNLKFPDHFYADLSKMMSGLKKRAQR